MGDVVAERAAAELGRLPTGAQPMAFVLDTDIVARQVGRWDPSDIAYVRRISFENWDGPAFDLALLFLFQPRPPLSAGWPDPLGKFWEADISFKRVRDLSVTICGPWDIQTPGFALEDIHDRHWEGVNLLVYDYEGLTQENIRFGAESAQVRTCQPTLFAPNSPGMWREYPGVFGGSGVGDC
jgi:hypothetical protein